MLTFHSQTQLKPIMVALYHGKNHICMDKQYLTKILQRLFFWGGGGKGRKLGIKEDTVFPSG